MASSRDDEDDDDDDEEEDEVDDARERAWTRLVVVSGDLGAWSAEAGAALGDPLPSGDEASHARTGESAALPFGTVASRGRGGVCERRWRSSASSGCICGRSRSAESARWCTRPRGVCVESSTDLWSASGLGGDLLPTAEARAGDAERERRKPEEYRFRATRDREVLSAVSSAASSPRARVAGPPCDEDRDRGSLRESGDDAREVADPDADDTDADTAEFSDDDCEKSACTCWR
jgi:hypothetical protein